MKDTVNKTAESINDAARDIWLAGLGAFSRAQAEGAKAFDGLVKEGTDFENRTRKDVKDRIGGIRGNIENRVKSAREDATGNFRKLESVFEERVAQVLARLGIPTADDVKSLTRRVEELSEEVKTLNKAATKKAA